MTASAAPRPSAFQVPTAAERARTVLSVSPTVEVTAFGTTWVAAVHGVDADGRPLLLVADTLPAATRPAAAATAARAVVRAAELHVLRLADRIRARVELRGTIATPPADEQIDVIVPDGQCVLRIEAGQVTLDGHAISLADFRAARPDPLASVEAGVIENLLRQRPHDLVWLCTLLGPEPVQDATEIAPVALDRHGLIIRVTGPRGQADHRLGFPAAVESAPELDKVLSRLVMFARWATCERR